MLAIFLVKFKNIFLTISYLIILQTPSYQHSIKQLLLTAETPLALIVLYLFYPSGDSLSIVTYVIKLVPAIPAV